MARSIRSTTGRGQEFSAATEDQPVLRVEAHQLDLITQVTTDGLKDLGEDTRVEKERRPQVEAEAVAADRRGPAAHAGRPFEDRDLEDPTGRGAWPPPALPVLPR